MGLFIAFDSGEQFDDGATTVPGEAGFTQDAAKTHFGDKAFYYSGTPNWSPPEETAE